QTSGAEADPSVSVTLAPMRARRMDSSPVPSVSVADVPAKNFASVMRPSPSVTVSELPSIGQGYGAPNTPSPVVTVTDGGNGSSGPGPKYTHVRKKPYP